MGCGWTGALGLLGCALATLTVAVRPAVAGTASSDADDAAAEAMFQRGLADLLAGRYDAACPALAESLRIARGAGTLFTLAECERLRGRWASAAARYDEYLQAFAELTPAEQRRQRQRPRIARQQRARLEPLIPRLSIVLPDGVPDGATVVLDGATLPAPAEGAAATTTIDPGQHVVRLEAPGRAAGVEQELTIAAGESRRLELAMPPPLPPPLPPPPPVFTLPMPVTPAAVTPPIRASTPAPAAAPDQRLRTRRAWGVALAATGVALAAAGGAALYIAKRKVDAIDDAAARSRAGERTPYDESNGNYPSYNLAGTVLLSAGGAAIVSGAILYLGGRRHETAALGAAVNRQGAAASLALGF